MGWDKSVGEDRPVAKLRKVEALTAQGATVAEAAKKVGVSEQSIYRWKKQYGQMDRDEVKRLKELEAEVITSTGKPTVLYYFGDYDPSGVDISRTVKEGITEFVEDPDLVTFERVAVEPWQIEVWDLPTRPPKKTDSRSKGFKGKSVEVDALPPKKLRALVRECVERHLDPYELEMIREIEEQERATLEAYIEKLAC